MAVPDDAPVDIGRAAATNTSDNVRARELYKYFRPPTTATDIPDTVLTAHAQLLAWRLNAQRAMVSLIDSETQYFVAESTKTLRLDNAREFDDPDDANWVLQAAQCVDVPKAGRLCEHTIASVPPSDGSPACFEVCDLSQDDRFNTLEFVRGPPYFRYYIGVPLRTKKGINIGSIFAMDDKPREPASLSTRNFLGVMGGNVVQHLELIKEKRDRQRSSTMNRCLSAFVDPDHRAGSRRRRGNTHNSPTRDQASQFTRQSPHPVKNDGSSSPFDSDSSFGRRVEMDENLATFRRAAELLRESLDVEDGGGGVVFLDTMAARTKYRPMGNSTSTGEVSSGPESGREEGFRVSVQAAKPNSTSLHASHTRPAAILAQSHTPSGARQQFLAISTTELSTLIKRHPRGKRFTFEADGQLVSSSSDETPGAAKALGDPKPKKTTTSRIETELLKRNFPTARQIIFLPLWDSTASRWSACFAYNCSDYRDFSHNPEFLYCIAFCNCVMAEIAQLATRIADQQKSDFIGSISHEFRSPLHGILASCEFLGDTDCSTFQRSLIDTADGCARTLLDTINMVLDYSKINSLEKNVIKNKKNRRDTLWGGPSALQAQLNIYGDVNIALIAEEVVEGVATGYFFKDSANLDVNGLMDADSSSVKSPNQTNALALQKSNVDIVLDIQNRDWKFWSQAGALRRIVMNLFGNSLKYTKHGFIKVKLSAEDVQPTPHSTVTTYISLTVTDSGQGMSSEYMRSKLFTPFAQESSLTPGTGLGLSLVKSIVNMLGGEIEISSTPDVGTEVTARLPISNPTQPSQPTQQSSSSGSSSNPSSVGSSAEIVKDISVKAVQEEAGRRTIVAYWKENLSDSESQLQSSCMMRKSVEGYLSDWYGFQASTWDKYSAWDIIIAQETDIYQLIDEIPYLTEPNCKTMVLILRNTTATQMAQSSFPNCENFEQIRRPFGPYKFARALRICLERLKHKNELDGSGLSTEAPHVVKESTRPSLKSMTSGVEALTLSSPDGRFPDVAIIKNGTLSAREDSANAQMAMAPSSDNEHSHSTDAYPFPSTSQCLQANGTVSPTAEKELLALPRPSMAPMRRTISVNRQELRAKNVAETNAMSSTGALANSLPEVPTPTTRPPRMLLVDDNRINLKLLQTFMKKRKYTNSTSAQDGLQAVNAYEALLSKDQPPDIVLMDISMPVMNGFEATRKIREIEREHCAQLPPMQTPPSCLIIALTGLASARDQSEAFMSGFDMYITKPVSFAEISRLLDNWEANGGGAKANGLPHGAVTGGNEEGQAAERLDPKKKQIGLGTEKSVKKPDETGEEERRNDQTKVEEQEGTQNSMGIRKEKEVEDGKENETGAVRVADSENKSERELDVETHKETAAGSLEPLEKMEKSKETGQVEKSIQPGCEDDES